MPNRAKFIVITIIVTHTLDLEPRFDPYMQGGQQRKLGSLFGKSAMGQKQT